MAVASLSANVRALQITGFLTERLGNPPKDVSDRLIWCAESGLGVQQVVLHPPRGGSHQLKVVLAMVPETARVPACSLWALAASVQERTDEKAKAVAPERDDQTGCMEVAVCLKLRDEPFDVPRLARFENVLDALDDLAKELQNELPAPRGRIPEIPRQLSDKVSPLICSTKADSGVGDASAGIIQKLHAGMSVAIVAEPLRLRVELDRVARSAANLVVLCEPIAIHGLPELARSVHQAGLILATPGNLLRPRSSVYEQGRELEGTLRELAASPYPVLIFGTREELESTLGVGQGRTHSPLQPVIEQLPAAAKADLARVAFGEQASGTYGRLGDLVLRTIDDHAPGNEESLLLPLCNLAASLGPNTPDLDARLASMAEDLATRRDTFGQVAAAPAKPRPADVSSHLRQRLTGDDFEELLKSKLFGQDAGIREAARRVWQEAVCRSDDQPLRIFCAGPTGCGKSMMAKYLAARLDWPYHYIDAAAFDSEHAVASSLAGASPGIVNSFNDGMLARISRQPSVVEVADLDHARPGVRGVLCDFFLRCLEEGTLQTGAGAIVRTIPNLLFVFTSNVAWGSGNRADAKLGFACMTEDEVQARVISHAQECLGHAFVSRINDPIVFAPFTRETAVAVAENEIQSLIRRVCNASKVIAGRDVAERIVATLVTTDTGARGIIDATHRILCDSLRNCGNMRDDAVKVSLRGKDVVIEPDVQASF